MIGSRRLISFGLLCSALFVGSDSSGADFDEQQFQEELNSALEDYPGVTIEWGKAGDEWGKAWDLIAASSWSEIWVSGALENAPDHGFVVYDNDGHAVDILGGSVPYTHNADQIAIVGYDLPTGYSVSTVGATGYVDAVLELARAQRIPSEKQATVDAPSRSVGKAVEVVREAGTYIAQELCHDPGRPTELVFNLTAGFELVFNVETGTQVTWDLEVVCNR